MIDAKQIPDEAIEAALCSGGFCPSGDGIMRRAIAAALSAWPGASVEPPRLVWKVGLILPLPKEGE
jgi:hypothetical protein